MLAVIPVGSYMNPLKRDNLEKKPRAEKEKGKKKNSLHHFRTFEQTQFIGNCNVRRNKRVQKSPLYSMPHLSFTITGLPVRLFKKGFGLTGTA